MVVIFVLEKKFEEGYGYKKHHHYLEIKEKMAIIPIPPTLEDKNPERRKSRNLI